MAQEPKAHGSIRHCLSRLLTFTGRDGLSHFWPYALLIMLLGGTAMVAAMTPFIGRSMVRMRQLARDNPEDFIVNQTPHSYDITYIGDDPAIIAQMMPDFSAMMMATGLAMLLPIVLIAAAAVRRLHDRGISGKWLIIPAALLFAGFVVMREIFGNLGASEPDFGQFALGFAVNLSYLASVAVFIILFALPGKQEVNRYGPPPGAG